MLAEVTCCGSTIEPEMYERPDGSMSGTWRCPRCGLDGRGLQENFQRVFDRIAGAGLTTVPLFVVSEALSGNLA